MGVHRAKAAHERTDRALRGALRALSAQHGVGQQAAQQTRNSAPLGGAQARRIEPR